MNLTETVITAQKGDRTALEQLYNMYVGEVYIVVKNLIHDEHETEDITHDVFVTVMEKISSLKSPEAFHSWLKAVTVNKCRKFLRDRHDYVTDNADENGIEMMANTETGDFTEILPCEHLDSSETNKILYQAISELSEKHRTVIFMYYYCEMTIEKISEELGISQGTVKSRLNYARKSLEKKLKSYEKYGIKLYGMDIFSGLGNIISYVSAGAEIPQSLCSACNIVACTAGNLTSTAVSSAVSSVTAHTISHAAATRISVGTSAAAVITACTVLVTSSSPIPENTVSDVQSSLISETVQTAESSVESSAESVAEEIIESYIESSLEKSISPVIIRETSIVKEIVKETSVIEIEKEVEREVEKEVEKIVTSTVHDIEYIEVERSMPERDFSEYYSLEDGNYKYMIYPSVNEAVLMQVKPDNSLDENIVIPDNIEGIPVTEIGNCAFHDNMSIKSLTVPDSVTKISSCAFEFCMNLEKAVLGKNVEIIDGYAFKWCEKLKEVEFPENLRTVEISAFEKCPIESVAFGDKLKTISANAFSNSGITELDFKNAPVTIEKDAFKDCKQLKKIHFSPYMQFVGDSFDGCKALEEIDLFYNNIDYWYYSYKLRYEDMPEMKKVNITVCDGVKGINKAFFWCFAVNTQVCIQKQNSNILYSFAVPMNLQDELAETGIYGSLSPVSDYTNIDMRINKINQYNSGVKFNITLPDSLETIGEETFRNYTHLKSITIPEKVGVIEKGTFKNCFELEEINILNEDITISAESGIENTKWYQNQPDGEVYLGKCLIGIKNNLEN